MFVYLLVISVMADNSPITKPELINVFESAQSCIENVPKAKEYTEEKKKKVSQLSNTTFIVECIKKEVNK